MTEKIIVRCVNKREDAAFFKKFDQAVRAFIDLGLSDEEIYKRLASSKDFSGIGGDDMDLAKGRIRMIRQSSQSEKRRISLEPKKTKITIRI